MSDSLTLLFDSLTKRAKFGFSADSVSLSQIDSSKDTTPVLMPYEENSTTWHLDKKRGSRPSVWLQVKTKMVFGGKFVASSLLKREICAAGVMRSASSTRIKCILKPAIGTYWQVLRTRSIFSRLQSWLGMWCNSAGIDSAKANPIVVFPVPDGPTNNHALGNGLAANLLRIFRGFSSPTKESKDRGLYFSVRDCGNSKPGCEGELKRYCVAMLATAFRQNVRFVLRVKPIVRDIVETFVQLFCGLYQGYLAKFGKPYWTIPARGFILGRIKFVQGCGESQTGYIVMLPARAIILKGLMVSHATASIRKLVWPRFHANNTFIGRAALLALVYINNVRFFGMTRAENHRIAERVIVS